MGFKSIWDEDGNYLTKKSKGFRARSTGCDCCSVELTTKEEVEKEIIESFENILFAVDYFDFSIQELIKKAKEQKRKKQEA